MTKARVGQVVTLPEHNYRHIPEESLAYDRFVPLAKDAHPNAILAGEDIPESYAKSLTQRRRHPYYQEDGHIKVRFLNTKVVDGIRRGEVYFTWVKKEGQ